MKRFARAAVVVVTVAGSCLVLLVVARIPLAEVVIEQWLSGQGLSDPDVEVRRLGLNGLSASVARAGPDGDAQAGNLEIGWTVSGLVRGRVDSFAASQVRIPVDWQDDGLTIAGVSVGPFEAGTKNSERPIDLPIEHMHLRDVTFDLHGIHGPASLSLPKLDLDLSAKGALALSGELELTGRQGNLRADLEASGRPEGMLTARLTGIRGEFATGILTLSGLEGSTTFAFDALRPSLIEASLTAMQVEHPLAPWPPAGPASLRIVHDPDRTQLSLDVGAPGTPERLFVELSADPVGFDDDRAVASASLSAMADLVNRPELTMRGVELTLPLGFVYDSGLLSIRLASPGTVSFEELEAADLVRMSSPATLRVGSTDAPALVTDLESGALDLSLFVEADRLDLAVSTDSSQEFRLKTGFLRADFHRASDTKVLRGDISVEDPAAHGLNLSAASGTARFSLSGPKPDLEATARIAGLRHSGSPALMSPLDLVLHAEGNLPSLSIRGDATMADGIPVATLSGALPAQEGRQLAEIELGPFTFVPGELQPGTLSPALSAIEGVEGNLGARFVVPASGAISGNLRLDGLSFTLAGQRVQGLDSRIEIRDLAMPATATDQTITIDRIELPVPVEKVQVRFAIRGRQPDGAELHLAALSLETLGGAIDAGPQTVPLQAESLSLDVRVRGVELARIFEFADVDGVSGTGALHGDVPLAIEDGDLAIRSAVLTSDSGVLHIRSDRASDFLSGQGQSVDAALRALEDFRYSELSVRADKAAGGDAQLAVSVLGHNPAVLDGHPFRFNVNLTSNIDELVAAILRGYRIATDAVSRAGAQP